MLRVLEYDTSIGLLLLSFTFYRSVRYSSEMSEGITGEEKAFLNDGYSS